MKTNTLVRPHQALLVAASLCGCTTDIVSIGEERTSQLLGRGSLCADNVELEGDVRIQSQAELDALTGCEQIGGDLSIEIFEDTDLSPLAALRVVGGTLEIGVPPLVSGGEGLSLEELEALDAERGARIERMRAIADAGWLESLQGVEAIEQVGALQLLDISAPDLRAFARLRNVAAHHRSVNAGTLSIVRARQLSDLSGLDGIFGVRRLSLRENAVLESLDGVSLGVGLDGVYIGNNPVLSDLDALSTVESVQSGFVLAGSAARDLDALAQLEFVYERVEITDNPQLADATGLNGLGGTASLSISGNAALLRLPEFSALSTITRLSVEDNPQLEAVTLDALFLVAPVDNVRGRYLSHSADWLVIAGNERLRSIALAHGFPRARVLAIQDNPSLVSVDLGNLEQVGELLSIERNAQLAEVRLGELRNAAAIEVIDNPLLPTAALAAVPAFQSTFTGNADTPAP